MEGHVRMHFLIGTTIFNKIFLTGWKILIITQSLYKCNLNFLYCFNFYFYFYGLTIYADILPK